MQEYTKDVFCDFEVILFQKELSKCVVFKKSIGFLKFLSDFYLN